VLLLELVGGLEVLVVMLLVPGVEAPCVELAHDEHAATTTTIDTLRTSRRAVRTDAITTV